MKHYNDFINDNKKVQEKKNIVAKLHSIPVALLLAYVSSLITSNEYIPLLICVITYLTFATIINAMWNVNIKGLKIKGKKKTSKDFKIIAFVRNNPRKMDSIEKHIFIEVNQKTYPINDDTILRTSGIVDGVEIEEIKFEMRNNIFAKLSDKYVNGYVLGDNKKFRIYLNYRDIVNRLEIEEIKEKEEKHYLEEKIKSIYYKSMLKESSEVEGYMKIVI